MLYNAMPVVRFVFIKIENEEIRLRDSRRQEWSDYLQRLAASDEGSRKLKAADNIRRELQGKGAVGRILRAGSRSIIYSTKESSEEAVQNCERKALKSFDEKLNRSKVREGMITKCLPPAVWYYLLKGRDSIFKGREDR